MKKYWRKKRVISAIIGVPLLTSLVVAIFIGSNIAYQYEDVLTSFLCPPVVIEQLSDLNAEEGFELSKKIVQEGSILVKNFDKDTNKPLLPLSSSNKKVNVFGHGSVDWIIGGSGSGQVVKEANGENILFYEALDHYGIQYNKELKSMYERFFPAIGRDKSLDSLENIYYQDFYILYEPSLTDTNFYTSSLLNNAKNYSDTAFVVISRRAGETNDPPRKQFKNRYATDNNRHYLEISTEEEALLKYVGDNFEHTVVIINSTNTMELDFLDRIETAHGFDACLIVGATGTKGAEQIPYILYGDDAYPSGRTVDTYPYDFKYNVNYGYSGLENVHHYANGSDLFPHGIARNAGVKYTDSPSYVDYAEGIYVGYKWFETADAEHYWDDKGGYNNIVQYPFGYGLSYTTFDWEVIEVDPSSNSNITNLDEIKIQVRVTNTGNFKGKDVVEAYVTVPYYPGKIEKAYVSLVGIAKTPELAPGEDAVVTLKISAKEFESYDCYDANKNGFKGYELEKGPYHIKLMKDAHNIAKVKYNGVDDYTAIFNYNVLESIQVENDEITGNKVENRFTEEAAEGNISIDGSDSNANISYIHRDKFSSLNLDTFVAPSDRNITSNVRAYNLYNTTQGSAWDNASTDIFGNPVKSTAPTFGKGNYQLYTKGNPTELGYQLAKDYNDPMWDSVLDSIPLDEAVSVLNTGTHTTGGINSVGKPTGADYDGPAQVKSFGDNDNNPGTGFPCATVLAQSFSTDLAYTFGINYGKEMNNKGIDGAYAFGCNIHRSPFQGRNYEYLSEDGYLSGVICAAETRGLYNTGKYSYLKHLIVAECEHEREAMYTWLTEQSLREIYLKPFKIAIQNSECVGIMSSYNRLGGIWAGGCEHLIEGVLRFEYGFKGAIVTDWSDHNEYMNGAHSFRAGGNLCMSTGLNRNGFSNPSASSTPRVLWRVREGVKQVLYMSLKVKYQNQQYNLNGDPNEQIVSFSSINGWVWWKPVITALKIIIIGGAVIGFYAIFMPDIFPLHFKKKKETNTSESES